LLRLEVQTEAAKIFRDTHALLRVVTSRGEMSTKDRASNRVQDVKGRVKEATGRLFGNRDLKVKGETDVAKSELKITGEDLKDAAHQARNAVTK
jgi:uncharacterized protein YjbJ (UPF0337 family)